MLLKFNVNGQKLSRRDFTYVVEKSNGFLKCEFDLSHEWQDLEIEAIFQYREQRPFNVLLTKESNNIGVCTVPNMVIEIPYFTICLIGRKDGNVLTTNVIKMQLIATGNLNGLPESEWKEVRIVDLDFSEEEQMKISPKADKILKEVIINKPETLIPQNIAKGVTIAGIEGQFVGEGGSTGGGGSGEGTEPPVIFAEETTVELNMPVTDQVIIPKKLPYMKKATVLKPSTLVPSNVKKGVNIGGVVGTYGIEGEERVAQLDMTGSYQMIYPKNESTMKQVLLEKPDTFTPSNIKEGVNIGGVVGTLKTGDLTDVPKCRFWYLNDDYDWVWIEIPIDENRHAEPPFMEQIIPPKEMLGPGLTFDEWTGEYDDVWADRDIIANYITTDGATHVYFYSSQKKVYLSLDITGTMLVDWGEGTDYEEIVGRNQNLHTYSRPGKYHITIKSKDEDSYFSQYLFSYYYDIVSVGNSRLDLSYFNIDRFYMGENINEMNKIASSTVRPTIITLSRNFTLNSASTYIINSYAKIIPFRKNFVITNQYFLDENRYLESLILSISSGDYIKHYIKDVFSLERLSIYGDEKTHTDWIPYYELTNFNFRKNQVVSNQYIRTNYIQNWNYYTLYNIRNLTFYRGVIDFLLPIYGTNFDSIEFCKDSYMPPARFSTFNVKRLILNCKLDENYSYQGEERLVLSALDLVGGLKKLVAPGFDELILKGMSNLEELYVNDSTNVVTTSTCRLAYESSTTSAVGFNYFCGNLRKIVAGTNLQTIDFLGYPARLVDLRKCINVVALSRDISFEVQASLKVVVPDLLYDEYLTATNWVSIKNNIIRASEYREID